MKAAVITIPPSNRPFRIAIVVSGGERVATASRNRSVSSKISIDDIQYFKGSCESMYLTTNAFTFTFNFYADALVMIFSSYERNEKKCDRAIPYHFF